MGKSPEDLAKSVFVEKLHARGYEVLLLGQPLDEIFLQALGKWKYVMATFSFQLSFQLTMHIAGSYHSRTSLRRV